MMLERNMWEYFDCCLIELMCYVWWLAYRLICNHYGWNETSVLGVERKPRYHGYIHLHALVWLNWYSICDDRVIDSYVIVLVEMNWGLKGNQSIIVTHAPISFRMVEYDCCYDWMMNSFAIILIEMKSEYWGLKRNRGTVIADGSLWGQWIWNKVWKFVIEC